MVKLKTFINKLSEYAAKNGNAGIMSIGTNHNCNGDGYSLYLQLESGIKDTLHIPAAKEHDADIRTVNLKLTFFYDGIDEQNETRPFAIRVPAGVSNESIMKELKACHEYLSLNSDNSVYGTEGEHPGTLIRYVCRKNNWHYKQDPEFDIEMDFF